MEYDPKFCQEIIDFFNVPHTVEVTFTYTNKHGETKSALKTVPNPNPPTLAGFATNIGALVSEIAKWRGKYPDFDRAFMIAMQEFDDFLQKLGIIGAMNPIAFSMFAKEKLGWKDSSEDKIITKIIVMPEIKSGEQPVRFRLGDGILNEN